MSALRQGFEWVVSDGNELIPDTDCLVESKLLHLNRTFYSVAPRNPRVIPRSESLRFRFVWFGRGKSEGRRHQHDALPFQQE